VTHKRDTSDLEAILARRALLVSTALAALSCGSPEGPTSEAPTSATATAMSSHSAVAATSSSAKPPAALASWDEVVKAAPPRGIPASMTGLEKQQFEWLEQQLTAEYDAIRAVYTGAPDCDAADASCRASWREVGNKAKAMYDATRGRGFGGCGSANGETASLLGRRNQHRHYLEKVIADAEQHLTDTAASFSAQGEQEWRKLMANAKQVPPMPCLSPCPMPDVRAIMNSIPFAAGSGTLGPQDPAKATLKSLATDFKTNRKPARLVVRGHADATEPKPAELALARAKAVAAELIAAGVDKATIETFSYSSDLPLERGSSDANRRVDFEVVPKTP
jgi:outer membrane protein OmpA-like peptidoglycan-associated protein